MGLSFCSLASGSSGNCYIIKSSEAAILIDAGISTKKIHNSIDELGVLRSEINGVFITHEHSDHIKALPVLTKKNPEWNIYAYSTGKETVNVIVVGTVAGAAPTGEFTDINKGITLKLPDAAKVTFSGVTFGEGQMRVVVWNEAGVQSMTVPHRMRSITFDGCTFKGNWLQNGAVGVDSMTFTGCTFEKYENTAKPGNSNPIWIQNMGYCNVTFDDCRVNACRPLKLWENDVSGDVTIKDTKFIMSKCSEDNENTHKNVAVMFSTINHPLGDIAISDNTVTGDATGFISFYDKDSFAMKEDASFTVTNNQLPAGVETSVKWKEASAYGPDKMVVTPYTPAPHYYYHPTTDTKADDTKGSPKTFDAGVGIYAVTAVLSATGMAWTAKKRH